MKNTVRTCILLASFSLPSLALAQPSLTLYGVADSGFGYEGFRYKGQGQSVTVSNVGLQESYLKSSRWGLKGTETLSSDLNVFLNFEQEIKLLTGQAGKAPRGFNRKSVLGLRLKSFGTLSFGRQKTLGKDFLKLETTKGMGKPSRAFGVSGLRTDNLIKYISPKMRGFRVGVGYATNGGYELEKTGSMKSVQQDYLVTTGAHYAQGPWSVGGVYDVQRPNDKTAIDWITRYVTGRSLLPMISLSSKSTLAMVKIAMVSSKARGMSVAARLINL